MVQEIASIEKRSQGKWTTAMLADYWWTFYNRQAKRTKASLFLYLNNARIYFIVTTKTIIIKN